MIRTSFIDSRSIPKLVNVRCVYQLTFSNGRFYIGSTNNLQKRLAKWGERLLSGDINKKIKFFVKDKFDCKVDVLEYVEDRAILFDREDYYIKRNIVNPMLLNRAKGAYFSSKHTFTSKEKGALKGTSFTPERKRQISDRLKGRVLTTEWKAKIKESERRRAGKQVNQYTPDGVFVKAYRCIGDAAEALNISSKSIRKVAYKTKKKTHGFVFRLAERDQSI